MADLAGKKTAALKARLESWQPVIEFNDRLLLKESGDILDRVLIIIRAYRANKQFASLAAELTERARNYRDKLADTAGYAKPARPKTEEE